MNSSELKKKLHSLASKPLERLSSSEIKKISTQLDQILFALEKVHTISRVEELLHSIALENKPFYTYLLQKFSHKKPAPTAKREAWEKYHKNLESYLSKCKLKRNELNKTLDQLQKMKTEQALLVLKKLKAEDKKLLSLLASLTERKSRGVSSIHLGNTRAGNEKWLQELKNIKQLGVLANDTF